MKSITIEFQPKESLVLPFAHFEALQGLVYRLLSFDADYASSVHELKRGGRDAIKLFCFSDLRGEYAAVRETKALHFNGKCAMEIRSANDRFIEVIGERLTVDPAFLINDCPCAVSAFQTAERSFLNGALSFSVETPAVAYQSKGKKTLYYSPEDPQFYEIVKSNLKKKYAAVFGREYEGDLSFERVRAGKKCVTRYKEIYVTGYYGEYRLAAAPDLLRIAYFCGIGSKNSMGFGTVSPVL